MVFSRKYSRSALLCLVGVVASWGALQRYAVVDSLFIDSVWSGHPVGFAFIGKGSQQYLGYYDKNRAMVIAKRDRTAQSVQKVTLPSTVGWDSHNYIAMAIDSRSDLHVSGNMHSSALVYFRSTSPEDITTIKSAMMVGTMETLTTYPLFFNGPENTLVFNYRDGSSGNGNQVFNRYDARQKQWLRLLDKPLFDGEGARNAYMGDPVLGPDGYYHVYWSWRETPVASTTHEIAYIRSRDLLKWETITGKKLILPITLSTPGVIIDPVPQNAGIINRGAIGFDSQNRPIITYHKYDAQGFTQLYNARWEGTFWKIYQTSSWNYRWEFTQSGSLIMEITFGPVVIQADGSLTQVYCHSKNGTGLWQLDEGTLKPVAELGTSLWPVALEKVRRSGMDVHWVTCSGTDQDPATLYALRWETMPVNQDQPRSPVPAATSLTLYTFSNPNVATALYQGEKRLLEPRFSPDNGVGNMRAAGSNNVLYDFLGRKSGEDVNVGQLRSGAYLLRYREKGVSHNCVVVYPQ